MTTYLPNIDYMTDLVIVVGAQNGQLPFAQIKTIRTYSTCVMAVGLSAFIHVDVLFEAYFTPASF